MSNLLGFNQVLHDFIENRRTELATAPGFRFFVPLIITGGAEGNENVLGKGVVLANFGSVGDVIWRKMCIVTLRHPDIRMAELTGNHRHRDGLHRQNRRMGMP